jgi:hypothetical protein
MADTMHVRLETDLNSDVSPADLAQLTLVDWVACLAALVILGLLTVRTARIIENGDRFNISTVTALLLVANAAGTLLMLFGPAPWTLIGMLIGNIGTPLVLFGGLRFIWHLNSAYVTYEPTPWKKLGLDMVPFSIGLGVLALAMSV